MLLLLDVEIELLHVYSFTIIIIRKNGYSVKIGDGGAARLWWRLQSSFSGFLLSPALPLSSFIPFSVEVWFHEITLIMSSSCRVSFSHRKAIQLGGNNRMGSGPFSLPIPFSLFIIYSGHAMNQPAREPTDRSGMCVCALLPCHSFCSNLM